MQIRMVVDWMMTFLLHYTVYSQSTPKQVYTFYDETITWVEAQDACTARGAHLPIISDKSVLRELLYGRTDFRLQVTFWLGLSFNGTAWTWQNGEDSEWTNWMNSDNLPSQKCAVVRSEFPYGWSTRACNDTYAYVCVEEEGPCNYTIYQHSSLVAHNDDYAYNVTPDECIYICTNATDYVCRSFEYNSEFRFCQFSSESRWSKPESFSPVDMDWTYYHRTCTVAVINITYIEVHPTSTQEDQSPETTPATIIVCREELVTDSPTFLPTEKLLTAPPQSRTPDLTESPTTPKNPLPIVPLIGHFDTEDFLNKRRMRGKISAEDDRPSAVGIGMVAGFVLVAILSGIILLDVTSFINHCKYCKESIKQGIRQGRPVVSCCRGNAEVEEKWSGTDSEPPEVNRTNDAPHFQRKTMKDKGVASVAYIYHNRTISDSNCIAVVHQRDADNQNEEMSSKRCVRTRNSSRQRGDVIDWALSERMDESMNSEPIKTEPAKADSLFATNRCARVGLNDLLVEDCTITINGDRVQ